MTLSCGAVYYRNVIYNILSIKGTLDKGNVYYKYLNDYIKSKIGEI